MAKYLFLFTISPVQSFIEQARKTQDLYAGSRMLSDLITKAMEFANQHSAANQYESIFPSIDAESKPNRFIALIEPKEDIQSFGNQVKRLTDKYFVDILGNRVIQLFPDSEKQIRDILKTYWVASKYDKKNNFTHQITNLEKKLGSVKNIRYFNQFVEKGRKCSIDGIYNVKFYRKTKRETERNIEVFIGR